MGRLVLKPWDFLRQIVRSGLRETGGAAMFAIDKRCKVWAFIDSIRLGLADLAEGEGITFDILEINMIDIYFRLRFTFMYQKMITKSRCNKRNEIKPFDIDEVEKLCKSSYTCQPSIFSPFGL